MPASGQRRVKIDDGGGFPVCSNAKMGRRPSAPEGPGLDAGMLWFFSQRSAFGFSKSGRTDCAAFRAASLSTSTMISLRWLYLTAPPTMLPTVFLFAEFASVGPIIDCSSDLPFDPWAPVAIELIERYANPSCNFPSFQARPSRPKRPLPQHSLLLQIQPLYLYSTFFLCYYLSFFFQIIRFLILTIYSFVSSP